MLRDLSHESMLLALYKRESPYFMLFMVMAAVATTHVLPRVMAYGYKRGITALLALIYATAVTGCVSR